MYDLKIKDIVFNLKTKKYKYFESVLHLQCLMRFQFNGSF